MIAPNKNNPTFTDHNPYAPPEVRAKYLIATCVILLAIIQPVGAFAKSCKTGEKPARNCIKLMSTYPLIEDFLFSQRIGKLYRYHNDCKQSIDIDATFHSGAIFSSRIKADGYADIPCGSECVDIDQLSACETSQDSDTATGATPADQPEQVDAQPPSTNKPEQVNVQPPSSNSPGQQNPSAALAPDQKTTLAPNPSQTEAAISKFTLRDNRDIWQYDIPLPNGRIGVSDTDINACAARCDSDPACKAFAFDRWKLVCYMKNAIPESTLLDARSSIGIRKPATLPNASTTAQPHIEPLAGWRFHGTLSRQIHTRNSSQCKAACDNDLHCIAYTYLNHSDDGKNCDMYNLSDHPDRDDSADSGFKYQSE